MTPSEVETVYEALARQIDATPPDRRELFLAKLALLLAHELGDATRVTHLVTEAAQSLDA